MIKRIVIISNIRMFFIFLLLNKDPFHNLLFIFDENVNISPKILNLVKVKRSKGILDLIIKSVFYFIKFKFLCIKLKLGENVSVCGADHISGAKYFLKRYRFTVLEDGTINYLPKSYVRSFKNKLFSIPVYGMYKNVDKIILTKPTQIPDCIKDKVEIIDLNKEWENKNSDEKKHILSQFNIDLNNIEIIKNKKYILYTQPLSEDHIIQEEEKIDLYKKVLNGYDLSELVIKPHPREKTDYSKYFKSSYIFSDNIPAELLSLLGINFEKVITLFSTAVLQHNKESIVFLGTEVHPKLCQHFGKINL